MFDFSEEEKKEIKVFVSHFATIKRIRETFQILFEGGEHNERILKRAANEFFGDLSDILVHYLILRYAALLDLAKDNRGNKNLTLDSIKLMNKWSDETNRKFDALTSDFHEFKQQVREARNQIIAHNDWQTYMDGSQKGGFTSGKDIEFLERVEDLLNAVSEQALGQSFGLITSKQEEGVGDLMHYLIRGIAFEEMLAEGDALVLKMNGYLDKAAATEW